MRKKNSFKIIIPLICILLFPGIGTLKSLGIKRIKGNEYVSIFHIINIFNIDNTFDIISNRGKLYHRDNYAVYNVGFSYIIINGRLYKSDYPIIRYKGEVLLPLVLGKVIIKNIYPSTILTRSGYRLKINRKKKLIPPDISKKNNYNLNKAGKDRISFIVIDPGHGGKDPGAIGKGGLKEKVITNKIARNIEIRLKRRLKGIKIYLTRKSDRFIELSKRTEIANKLLKKYKNGMFVSIHVNASISRKISGFETYFLSQNPTNEEARNTAALENNVIVLEENNRKNKYFEDVDYIEAMMLTTQIQKESSLLAHSLQRGMKRNIREFKSRGVRKADFFVLRGVLMPAVLVEVGFITNRREAQYLKKSSYQKKIAKGIADGVIVFIKKYNRALK